jgi:uncharacterized repeat protein (TIGR01451 family)
MNRSWFSVAKKLSVFSLALIGLTLCLVVLPASQQFNAASADAMRYRGTTPDQQTARAPMPVSDSYHVSNASANAFVRRQLGRGMMLAAARAGSTNALLSPFGGPSITATKTVSPASLANPGDTLMYTVVISNAAGGSDATGVVFSDTIDPNTTLVPGSLNSSPLAINDTYTASGNIAISKTAATGVLANDIDPDTANNTGLTVTQVQGAAGNVGVATNTTASGIGGVKGSVILNANGSFTYEPPPGFIGSDTFTYQISDVPGKNDTGTVTITVSGMAWFINNNAAGSLNRGTFSNPFTTIASFNTANSGAAPNPQPGQTISLRTGTGTYNETDGINLRDNQVLIGEAVQFNTVFAADASSIAAYNTFASGTNTAPVITTTAGNGVDLGSGNTVRGLNVGNTPAFFGFNGGAVGSPIINTVGKTGTGGALNVSTSGAFGANVTFATLESTSSAGANLNLVSVTGTLSVSSAGTGFSGSAAASAAININGGSVILTYPGNVTKASTGALLSVSGGHSGTLTFNTGTLSATSGTGLQFDNADGTYNFNGTTTLNGGDAGVDILNGSSGTFSFGSNTTITSPTGAAFNVNSSSPSVTYSGSITQNTSGQRVVNIDTTTSNTITFQTGTITGGSSSTGVNINAANGTVTFSNGMTLGTSGSRMTNQAVTIAGGTGTYSLGVVSIFTNNASGIVATNADGTINCAAGSVVDSSGATAININGPAGQTSLGMSLTSVTSAGGTADGIFIQNTNGSFTVNGDGTNVTVGGNSSGGTISGKSGADGSTTSGIGVFANNATNITLRRMTINGTNQNFGIRGTSVTAFVLEYSTVGGTEGTSTGADEGSIIFDGLFGTSTFTNIAVSGSIEDNFRIRNSSGTSDVTITGSTFTNAPDDNIIIEPSGTSTVTAHVTNNTFTGAGGDHLQTSTTNSATLNIVFTGNLYSNGFPGSLGGGVTISGGNLGSTEHVNFNVSNNGTAGNPLIGDVGGGALNINEGQGAGVWQGQVNNNFVGNAAVANSGASQSSCIRVENHSTSGTLTATVDGNTLRQWNNGAAINTQAGDAGNATNTGTLNIKITNNNIANPGAGSQHGIVLNIGAGDGDGTAANQACADIKTNTLNLGATPPNGGFSFRLRQREASTVRLPGYTGPANNGGGQVDAFIAGQNSGTPNSTSVSVSFPTGGGYINTPGGAACTAPVVPTSVQPGDMTALSLGATEPVDDSKSESTLRTTRGEGPYEDNLHKLRQEELTWMIQAAIARWVETGISPDDLARLQAVTFEVTDLPNSELASLTGKQVKIDESAAGYGWFYDQSPSEDGEFQVEVPGKELHAAYLSPARGRIDLLSVLMRELGEIYLQGKELPQQLRQNILPMMEPTLSPGVRRLPLDQFRITRQSVGSKAPAAAADSLLASVTEPDGEPGVDPPDREVAPMLADARYAMFTSRSNRAQGMRSNIVPAIMINNADRAKRSRRVGYSAPFVAPTFTVPASGSFTLPPGKSVTIMFQATINALNTLPVGTSQVCNQGTVSGSNFGPVLTDDPGKPGATDPTCTTLNVADLAVTKTDSPDPVIAGSNITYTVNFVNNGPAAALTTTVTDAVPANTTFVSAVVTTGTGWGTTAPAVGGTGNIVFSKASVASGETAVFTIVVKVTNTTPHLTVISNTVTAASTTNDTTPANNTASATTTVTGLADLVLTKTASPTPNVVAGNNITYTLNFTNNGPGTAVNVAVTDAVPANTTFVSAVVTTGTGWGVVNPAVGGTGNVVFSKASVASGETAVFTIVVNVAGTVTAGTVITNTGTATANTSDPTPADATSTTTTTVIAQADLAVTKTDTPDPVIAGNNITYTVNFVNNGPGSAITTTVTDAVPVNTTFVSATVTTGTGWGTTAPAVGGTGNVVFSKATVPNGETAVFTIVVKVNASTANGTTITNTATAASTTSDPTPGNNSDTATTTVNTQADLAVTKSDSPDPVIAGANITYTINFVNNGPSDAQTVTVTDAVPANTTFVSATVTTGTGWGTTAPAVGGTGNVVFSKATVAAAETAVFTIIVKVNSNTADGTVISNSATAATTTTDPTSGNNTGTATTTVQARADLSITKTDSPDPVSAGGNLTYTVNFINNGPSDAQTVMITDAVPANATFVSAVVSTGVGWGTAAPSVGGTGNIVFTKATVVAGEAATFTIVVKINSNTASGATISNTATAASATTDPTPANNSATATTTVQTSADLAVTKSDSPDPSFAGTNITYTINFVNNGPSDAQTVTVTDAVPTNTTFVSATVTTGTGWSTTAPAVGGTGNVVFSKATVTSSETAVFTIVVLVDASTATGTVITNSATAASTTTDPTPGNNTGTATTTIQAQADLAVTKTDSPDPVLAGNNITYTINFVNNGPGAAQTVTVTDAVPANATFVSAVVTTGTGWGTTAPAVGGTGNVVFSKATVANGETAVFTMVVKVNSNVASGATITNSATAASTTADPTPGNNTGTATTTVNTQADLSIVKTDSPDPVVAGANITYTITLTNNGPSDAQTVTVTDTVPPTNTTLVSAMVTTGTGWSQGGSVTFSKPTVAAGETAVFTIVVKVNSNTAQGTVISNTATAATVTTDPNSANDSSTATTAVIVRADLAVTKSDSPDPVIAGNNLTYTINYINNGPSDAQTVTVTDAVPANATFVSAAVTVGAGWSVSAPAVGGTGNIVFSKATSLALDAATFTIVVNINPSTANGATITNSATAATATADPTPGNNTGTATTTVQTVADLAVTKSDAPDPVFAGNNITYTVNFVNNGPSFAQNVTVTDAVPANTTFVSATVTTGSGWSTSAPAVGGTGNVMFSKDPVANGETAVFTIVVKVNTNTAGGTTITNSAVGASTTTDNNPGNNTGTATTTVQTQADLAVTKTDSPDPVIAGNNLTYTLNFINNGPSDAQTVTVTDPVPANATFVSATVTTGSGWSTTAPAVGGTGNIVFSKAMVVGGETAVFTIVVHINANTPGGSTITNTATAASATGDPTPGNNSATATTAVLANADLVVTKTDSPDPVFAGNNLTYTINFANNGPSDAQTVTVTDAVPANSTFVSATVTTGTGWSTTAPAVGATGNVVFSKATVAAGETAVFTIVVKVNSNTANGATITNSATAASTTTDPTPGNNTGTATTTVQTRADIAVTKSDSPDPVFAGANLTYTINFVNNGPSDAQTVTVTDAVPANTTFVSATVTTGSGWSTSAPAVGGTGNVVFSKAAVTASETAVFTIVVKVSSSTTSGTTITNTATAATATTDPTSGNNSSTTTTTVQTQADISVVKTDSPDPVVVSQNLTYTINFANNGPSDAQTVTVTDPMPPNTTFVSATVTTGSGWSTSAPAVGGTGTITFSKPTVAAGQTAVFTIVVNVNLNTPNNTILTNTATAATATADPNTGNNTSTTTTTVLAQADLAITKMAAPDPSCVGGDITYTLNIVNNGPGPGINTTVTDATPANTTFVSASVMSGSGWSISAPAVGGTGNVVFSKASFGISETAVLIVVVKVNAGTVHGTVISNTGTIASSIPDPTPGNNSSSASTTVDPIPPTITCPANVTAKAPVPGQPCTVVNYNPPVASDNCPGVQVVCVPPSGTCFPLGTTTVTCTATDLAGNSANCSFTVTLFDLCVQDDSDPSTVVLINSTTGDYRFCCHGVVYTGKGTITNVGLQYTLTHNATDRRVLVKDDEGTHRATGSIQSPPGNIRCSITDRNTQDNSCTCP